MCDSNGSCQARRCHGEHDDTVDKGSVVNKFVACDPDNQYDRDDQLSDSIDGDSGCKPVPGLYLVAQLSLCVLSMQTYYNVATASCKNPDVEDDGCTRDHQECAN